MRPAPMVAGYVHWHGRVAPRRGRNGAVESIGSVFLLASVLIPFTG